MTRDRYTRLLRDSSRCGVYHAPQMELSDLIAAAEIAGFATFRIDLEAVDNKRALLERLAAALEFPDWFGYNWDALADCLGDLSWLEADGYLIFLERCDGFRANHPGDFAMVLRIFSDASEFWRRAQVPFWVFVDLHANGIAFLPGLD